MFDPVCLTHDECIERINQAIAMIDEQMVIGAFVASLSSQKLYWRSAIVSYFNCIALSPHEFVLSSYDCQLCKDNYQFIFSKQEYKNEDINVLNFERIRWGGLRHNRLLYCLFDLEEFIKQIPHITKPTDKDKELLLLLIELIETCKPTDTPRKLQQHISRHEAWKKVSNKDEIDVLIEIFWSLGILVPKKTRNNGNNDWGAVEDWRGEDGYDKSVVKRLFGL